VKEKSSLIYSLDEVQRVDKFLQGMFISRSLVEKLIKSGNILVNKKKIKKSYLLAKSDVIDIFQEKKKREITLASQKIDFRVIYEDKYLVIIDKPAGLTVHPGNGKMDNTLVNGLIHRFGADLSNCKGRPGIVHRLDKDTSGVLIIAKNDESHIKLSKIFAQRAIKKEYYAIVLGILDPFEGRIENFLSRSRKDFKKFVVAKSGKNAITTYKTCEVFDFFSLIKVQIKTGRTHQIRVHMAHLGHSILGDTLYSNAKNAIMRVPFSYQKKMKYLLANHLQRQALHAHSLEFIHPNTHQRISKTAPLPRDFLYTVKFLRDNFETYKIEEVEF